MRALITFGVEIPDSEEHAARLLAHLGDQSAEGAVSILDQIGTGEETGTLDVVDVEVIG